MTGQHPSPRRGQASLIDRSVKALIRYVSPTLFRLAGLNVDPRAIRPTDVAVNLPEFRADQVFIVGEEDDPSRWAIHLEYQLQPDPRVVQGWFLKNAALTAQLGMPVILIVVYLTRGRYRSFPSRYTVQAGGFRTEFRFHTLRLWEHADRIRSGELAALAPLLVLCEDRPTEETLRQERELILGLDVSREVRAELLAVAVTVGTRFFPRAILETFFREEMQMLKEVTWLEELISQWADERAEQKAEQLAEERAQVLAEQKAQVIAEERAQVLAEQKAQVLAEQKAQVLAEQKAQVLAEQKAQELAEQKAQELVAERLAGEAQEFLLRLLREQFGELPSSVVTRIKREDPAWCRDMAVRLLSAKSLEDLGLAS